MDPPMARGVREGQLDLEEGADIVWLSRAAGLSRVDLSSETELGVPVAAYNV